MPEIEKYLGFSAMSRSNYSRYAAMAIGGLIGGFVASIEPVQDLFNYLFDDHNYIVSILVGACIGAFMAWWLVD